MKKMALTFGLGLMVAACAGPATGPIPDPGAGPTSGPTGGLTAGPTTTPSRAPGTTFAIGRLGVPRAAHTAVRLDDGRILIAGGCSRAGCEGNQDAVASELFEPADGSFAPGPAMTSPRAGHTATVLADGRVLVVGGYPGEGRPPLASAELFDPNTNRFMTTGSMAQPRGSHTATALADGRVLVVGGVDATNEVIATVEIYDPGRGEFAAAASLPVAVATHTAVRLSTGEIMVAGGRPTRSGAVTASAVIYDPTTDSWRSTGDLQDARYKHAAVALPTGGALVIGGADARDFRGSLTSIEQWDPTTGAWTVVADMLASRFKIPDAVAVLADGRVLIAGDGLVPEIYDPSIGGIEQVRGTLRSALLFATATALADGRVLIAGGYDDDIAVQSGAYIFQG